MTLVPGSIGDFKLLTVSGKIENQLTLAIRIELRGRFEVVVVNRFVRNTQTANQAAGCDGWSQLRSTDEKRLVFWDSNFKSLIFDQLLKS